MASDAMFFNKGTNNYICKNRTYVLYLPQWKGGYMEVATSLARGVRSVAPVDAAYDAACKRMLSEKVVLSRILHEWVDGFDSVTPEEIERTCFEGDPRIGEEPVERDEHASYERVRQLNVEDSTVGEGENSFDVRFAARNPGADADAGEVLLVEVDVEAQNKFDPGYPLTKRGVYYAGRMLSMQGSDVVANSHYERLRKVISVWVCVNVPEDKTKTVTRFSLEQENLEGGAVFKRGSYDLVDVIVVCLGEEAESAQGTLGLLGTLFARNMSVSDKLARLRDEFGIALTREQEGLVEDMCNLSVGVREAGRKEGRKETLAAAVRDLKESLSLTEDEALDALRVPEEDRASIRELVNR